MGAWTQTVIALSLVAICAIVIGRQALAWFKGRASKLGSCCSKGCGAGDKALVAAKPAAPPMQFMPAELLSSSVKRRQRAGR